MKKTIFLLSFVLFTGSMVEASNLKCWNTYSKKGAKPILSATIVSDETLKDFELNTNKEDSTAYLRAPKGTETGEIITSNRSPYKGQREFDLAGSRLILPPQLDAQTLLDVSKANEGPARGENGVIIGTDPNGDGAGSHFSVRLRCRNYAFNRVGANEDVRNSAIIGAVVQDEDSIEVWLVSRSYWKKVGGLSDGYTDREQKLVSEIAKKVGLKNVMESVYESRTPRTISELKRALEAAGVEIYPEFQEWAEKEAEQ